jgi:hypothetical protein
MAQPWHHSDVVDTTPSRALYKSHATVYLSYGFGVYYSYRLRFMAQPWQHCDVGATNAEQGLFISYKPYLNT